MTTIAIGVDLDSEPLAYGTEHYLSQMSAAQQARVTTYQADVLTTPAQADIICAVNFSYFYFKARTTMKKYLTRCLETLTSNGILISTVSGAASVTRLTRRRQRMKSWATAIFGIKTTSTLSLTTLAFISTSSARVRQSA